MSTHATSRGATAVEAALAARKAAHAELARIERDLAVADPDSKEFAAALARRTQLREKVDVLRDRHEAAERAELEAAERARTEARRQAEIELASVLAEVEAADAQIKQELVALEDRLHAHSARVRLLDDRAAELMWKARGRTKRAFSSWSGFTPAPGGSRGWALLHAMRLISG